MCVSLPLYKGLRASVYAACPPGQSTLSLDFFLSKAVDLATKTLSTPYIDEHRWFHLESVTENSQMILNTLPREILFLKGSEQLHVYYVVSAQNIP